MINILIGLMSSLRLLPADGRQLMSLFLLYVTETKVGEP